MFSSREPFVSDPKPWGWFDRSGQPVGPRQSLGPAWDSIYGSSEFRPRLMQNNPTNPALVEVRELLEQGGAGNARPIVGIRLRTMEWDLESDRSGYWAKHTPETLAFMEHAVRVLRKWEAVYG